jgi:hypothetical protein
MSIIKSIKQVLGLSGTASENHFWDGSVPNQLSLKRGTPDAPGAELIKALNGALSFPSQGQSLTQNGYVKLPGGLIVQWGSQVVGINGISSITSSVIFPIPFPTACLCVVSNISNSNNGSEQNKMAELLNIGKSVSGYDQQIYAILGQTLNVIVTFNYLAIGY